MTLGEHVGAEFTKFLNGKFVSIGSVRNNEIAKKNTPKDEDVIGFISQWHPQSAQIKDHYFDHERFVVNVDRLVLQFIK